MNINYDTNTIKNNTINKNTLLNDNPHIIAQFFYEKFRLFKKHILKKCFKLQDYWIRYEF
jgi:hypothetical protein